MTILIVRLEVRNRVVSDLLARCSVLARAFDNDDDAQRWIAEMMAANDD